MAAIDLRLTFTKSTIHFTHKHKNCIIVLSPCMYMYVFMSHSDVVVIPRELPLDLRSKLITSLCYAGAKENTIKV